MVLDGGVDADTPNADTEQSVGEVVQGAWATLLDSLKEVCATVSMRKYGHPVGNLTSSDIAHELKSHGVHAKIASTLAKKAYDDHEKFRWSDDGKQIIEEFHKQIEE